MATLDNAQLLAALEPTVEENLNRHLAAAQEWMPHEYVPWSLGRDFAELGGDAWSPDQSQLSPIARTALEVNLLTEDNLPSYHRVIDQAFGRELPEHMAHDRAACAEAFADCVLGQLGARRQRLLDDGVA